MHLKEDFILAKKIAKEKFMFVEINTKFFYISFNEF